MDRVNEEDKAMRGIPETFQTAFERIRDREEIRALTLFFVWALSTIAGVAIPGHYGTKVAVGAVAVLVFLAGAYYYSPAAIFHRSWLKASDEVYGR